MATAQLRAPRARYFRFFQIRRLRPASAGLVVAAAAVAALAAPAPTSAAPQATLHQVKQRVEALNTQAEKITEAYDAARGRLSTLRRQAALSGRELHRSEQRLNAMESSIAKTSVAAYRNGGVANFMFLGSSKPRTFLNEAVTLDEISRTQADQLANAAAARRSVEAARTKYAQQLSAVHDTLARISSQRQHIESLIAAAHQQIANLKAAARARLAAQQQQVTTQQTALRSTYNGPATGQAAAAVRFAYAQLGKPYVYGAAGPSSYDCSGLTMAAWAAAGVSLPHNAAAQQASVPAVSLSALQPGDLVFFGSPAYHVGIYIGNGNMIHAPHTGDVVRIMPISYMTPSGAGRP